MIAGAIFGYAVGCMLLACYGLLKDMHWFERHCAARGAGMTRYVLSMLILSLALPPILLLMCLREVCEWLSWRLPRWKP